MQALEIEPKYLRALDRLGKLQMQRKDYNEARTTYSKILEIAPDSVEAKYQLMWLEKKAYNCVRGKHPEFVVSTTSLLCDKIAEFTGHFVYKFFIFTFYHDPDDRFSSGWTYQDAAFGAKAFFYGYKFL